MPVGAHPIRFSLPAGLATAVGALPQVAAAEWARFVGELMPTLPAAHAIRLGPEPTDGGAESELFAPVAEFLETMTSRVEPVVLSVTGPLSLALVLAEAGIADAAQVASMRVRDAAETLLGLADSLVPDASVLLFFEEPRLANSMHPTFPLSAEVIGSTLGRFVSAFEDRAMVGVTVDGRADWQLLLSTGITLLGAPVSAHLGSAGSELNAFFDRGGFVAWAAVPTDEPLGDGTDRLWRRLSAEWSELARMGVDPLLLRERSIITPASGLGRFGVAQAERALNLAARLSERVMNQVVGARLSVGA